MLTEDEVRARLRAAVDEAGGQKRFAEQHGFTPSYIHDVIHGRRPLAARILQAIGVERIGVYREAKSQEGS